MVHKLPLSLQRCDRAAEWWRSAVIYQLLVPSFKDTTGNGVGDLRGIIQNLDYLKDLGMDALWVSPILESPMIDFGYDIADYCKINPLFGTMNDFKELLDGLHKGGMKLILDIALNHTSAKHPWFLESKSSRDNPKHNWYIWRDPKINPVTGKNEFPNNWESTFEGSMWEYEPGIDQYYLHTFGTQQPDLNWDNPEVRQQVYKILRFWLDIGADGFRMDCINLVSKHPGLPDIEPPNRPGRFLQPANTYFANGVNIHQYISEMHQEVFAHYPTAVSIGELSCGIELDQVMDYVAYDRKELNLAFNFHHMDLDGTDGDKFNMRQWELPYLKKVINEWQNIMINNDGWGANYLENHDQPRCLIRFAELLDPKSPLRAPAAKMLATWLFTLQGTIFVFQGQELGLSHPPSWPIKDYVDIETLRYYRMCLKQLGLMEDIEGLPPEADDASYEMPSEEMFPVPEGGSVQDIIQKGFKELVDLTEVQLEPRLEYPPVEVNKKYGVGTLSQIRQYRKGYTDHVRLDRHSMEFAVRKLAEIMHAIHIKGRDNVRTPFPWNDGFKAGFTTAEKTWLKVNPDHTIWNVQREKKQHDSVLSFYRKIITFRKGHPVLISGTFELIDPDNHNIFAYLRMPKLGNPREQGNQSKSASGINGHDNFNNVNGHTNDTNQDNGHTNDLTPPQRFGQTAYLTLDSAYLVVLNFTSYELDWSIPNEIIDTFGKPTVSKKLILCNYELEGQKTSWMTTFGMKPFEARIYQLVELPVLLN